jgi:hypothetical protein
MASQLMKSREVISVDVENLETQICTITNSMTLPGTQPLRLVKNVMVVESPVVSPTKSEVFSSGHSSPQKFESMLIKRTRD